jgi:proton glutamate symport protein
MQSMENFGVPREIVAFILPTGYSFNLDGTCLYLSLASVFVAQAAGIHLSFGQQLIMVLTLMLTSKGVAILLGIDELVDMVRTMINVVGNCLASAVIARWEGKLVDNYLPKEA